MAKIAAEKPLSQAIKERRATPSFEDVPIHSADLEKIIRAGLEAPSGYNIQPWRFCGGARSRAKEKAAPGGVRAAQSRASQRGDRRLWRSAGWKDGDLEEMLRISAQHGFNDPAEQERVRKAVTGFLGGPPDKPVASRPRSISGPTAIR